MPDDQRRIERMNLPGEIVRLVSDITDGCLTGANIDRLSVLLEESDSALRYYVEWMDVHANLHYELVLGEIDLLALVPRPRAARPEFSGAAAPEGNWSGQLDRTWRLRQHRQLLLLSGAIAAAFLVCFSAVLIRNNSLPFGEGGYAKSDAGINPLRTFVEEPVAVLASAVDAEWEGAKPPKEGAALGRGTFRLRRGLAQIEFLSGANVIFEGPADFELRDSMSMACKAGRMRAYVPNHAIGFVVETPSRRVVDLGTEFAVSVRGDESEIHVLDGQVRLEGLLDAGVRPCVLKTGEGFRSDRTSGMGETIGSASAFVGREQMARLSHEASALRQAAWDNYHKELAKDPTLLLDYGFEGHEEWDRVVRNDGGPLGEQLVGAIVGCRWTTGRWPWKRALEFKRTSDRIRLNIPGEYESVTFVCWLRIEGLDRWLSSIVLTDGHDLGEPHWQFTETGQLLLGIKATDVSEDYLTPSVLHISDVGRWIQLACVYDGAGGRVTHFVDGQPVASHQIQNKIRLRFGSTQIGNWASEGFKDHSVRTLNGRIDELLLFDRALTEDEVNELYEQGRL